LPGKRKTCVLLATILASSFAYIDESVVNVAMPAIETDLATSVVVMQWLVNAYTLWRRSRSVWPRKPRDNDWARIRERLLQEGPGVAARQPKFSQPFCRDSAQQ
jgi:hypothetical protein